MFGREKGKLTPDVRLPFRLQRQQLIDSDERPKMDEKVDENRRPLDGRLELNFRRRRIVVFAFQRIISFNKFHVFRSPK